MRAISLSSFILLITVINTANPWLTLATERFDTGGLSRSSFPNGFVFGFATSAYQVEGMTNGDGRGPSIWDAFVKIPGKIDDNSTGDVTVDQYHRYKEDVDIMVDLNTDAYRLSISWSRIFPEGRGKINQKGVDYYNRLIDYLLKKGITPYVTLYHWDMPLALENEYLGLLSPKVVKDYTNYVDFCFKTYGDRVKNWVTFNEPKVIAENGYDIGVHAPGRCSKEYGNCAAGNSGTEPYIVAHNILLSHAAAVHLYREKYQEEQKGRIGLVVDFLWYEPLTSSRADNYAAQRGRDFTVGWFLHPLMYGEYPRTMQRLVKERLPKFTEEEISLIKGSYDFIGINQYTSYYILNPPQQIKPIAPSYHLDWNVEITYNRSGVPIGPMAKSTWLYIVPMGLYKSLTYVKKHYKNPTMIVTENGMDDPGNISILEGRQDAKRINFYKTYLSALKRAIDEGANVAGYFAWSFIDNFEWSLGYTSRFGIVYADFKDLKRYPKRSAYWFKYLLRRN